MHSHFVLLLLLLAYSKINALVQKGAMEMHIYYVWTNCVMSERALLYIYICRCVRVCLYWILSVLLRRLEGLKEREKEFCVLNSRNTTRDANIGLLNGCID